MKAPIDGSIGAIFFLEGVMDAAKCRPKLKTNIQNVIAGLQSSFHAFAVALCEKTIDIISEACYYNITRLGTAPIT